MKQTAGLFIRSQIIRLLLRQCLSLRLQIRNVEDQRLQCRLALRQLLCIGAAFFFLHRCTGKEYPTHPIKPGEKDSIIVTFNGERTAPRKFRTAITVHSNASTEMTKIYIKGEMTPRRTEEIPLVEIEEYPLSLVQIHQPALDSIGFQ